MPAVVNNAPEGALQELDKIGIAYKDVEKPASLDELQAIMAKASHDGLRVFPLGGGTALGTANPGDLVDIVLDMTGLHSIIRFDPKNLNLSVEAGLNIEAVNAFLAREDRGFFLPLDPLGQERATIGGIYASNSSGPWRQFYGTVRDLTLGAGALDAAGNPVKFGGVTVKNVSGYDLTKFFIGSAGSLCLITRVSFRILPLPDAFSCCEILLHNTEQAQKLLADIRGSVLIPSALLAVRGCAAGDLRILAAFEGHPKAVERQNRDLATMGEALGGAARVETGREAMQKTIREAFNPVLEAANRAVFKIAVPISKGAALQDAIRQLAVDQKIECRLVLLAGNGVVYAHFGYEQASELQACVPLLQDAAAGQEGHALPVQAPRSLSKNWGRRGNAVLDRLVLEPIKTKLDPRGILPPLNT